MEFLDPEKADNIDELNGADMGGRLLGVNEARPLLQK